MRPLWRSCLVSSNDDLYLAPRLCSGVKWNYFFSVFSKYIAVNFSNLNLPNPMSQDNAIDQLINDANDDVPSADFVPTPEMDSASIYVKPGSTKIVTGESDKGVWAMYTALAVVDEAQAREATNLEQPTARIRFFLDLAEGSTKDSIRLAKGVNKNVQLGRLLKATGNDKAGWKYSDIEGVNFKGRITHRADNKDASRTNVEVSYFSK